MYNASVLVGVQDKQGQRNVSWFTGLENSSHTPAPDDDRGMEEESFPIMALVIPILVVVFCGIMAMLPTQHVGEAPPRRLAAPIKREA